MLNEPEFNTDKAHRWFGVEFNSGIFPLLSKEDRNEEETETMIAMAYASTLHWSKYSGCKSVNKARGENMIATALTYAGRKEASLHHAERNYDIVFGNKNEMADFDVSYALMVMARSLALNGRQSEAGEYYEKCLESIHHIKDKEDKEIVESDLNSGPWFGLK